MSNLSMLYMLPTGHLAILLVLRLTVGVPVFKSPLFYFNGLKVKSGNVGNSGMSKRSHKVLPLSGKVEVSS